jgi:predicted nucleic acid-binding protein
VAATAFVIALDTNLLVYAHRSGTPEHRRARGAIESAAGSARGWGIALASVTEFWSIVTHPLVGRGTRAAVRAATFLRSLAVQGEMLVWTPAEGFEERLVERALALAVRGVRVFDLQIALTAVEHGATEIWTHDTRFIRVPGIVVRDPLV